jgi:hypothetical protein
LHHKQGVECRWPCRVLAAKQQEYSNLRFALGEL